MKEIKLTKNLVAMVDDDDFERVNELSWCATKNGTKVYALNNKVTRKYMHHFVYGKKCLIDHKDGNGINNCKNNLREANKSQNAANTNRKGVTWNKLNKNWRAKISINGKIIEIGSFQSRSIAISEYDKKKKELFGEYAS